MGTNTSPLTIKKPIVLIGHMGSGKSTVGICLAHHLDIPFLDVDQEIEKFVGCSISEIFKYNGESYFREVEQKTITSLLDKNDVFVLATGGGAIINDDTRATIKEKATSIWLQASIPVLLERVSHKQTRPLLQTGDKETILQDLIEKREPFYVQADIHVDTDHGDHEVIARKIIEQLNKQQKNND